MGVAKDAVGMKVELQGAIFAQGGVGPSSLCASVVPPPVTINDVLWALFSKVCRLFFYADMSLWAFLDIKGAKTVCSIQNCQRGNLEERDEQNCYKL